MTETEEARDHSTSLFLLFYLEMSLANGKTAYPCRDSPKGEVKKRGKARTQFCMKLNPRSSELISVLDKSTSAASELFTVEAIKIEKEGQVR